MADSEKYEVLGRIGQGSFGVISKVRRKEDGLILCRKEISYMKMSQKEKEQLQAELSILKELRHTNIVQYYERVHNKVNQDLHIYMEYCGNGDLGQVIKRNKLRNESTPESFVWSIFSQIVTALYRCHNGVDAPEVGDGWYGVGANIKKQAPKGQKYVIIHRDLKPENIFLDHENNVKLGDFGLSKIIQSHDFASTYVGTPYYMSPELAGNERYSAASDVWSLGCIVYELCMGHPPFNARSHIELFHKIRAGKFAPLNPIYSKELQKVVESCMQTNPNSRPTAAQLLDLPIVCVMRKQHEAVLLNKELNKQKKELAKERNDIDSRTQALKQEIDAKLRREWEVKARLEIDKHVSSAKADLLAQFDTAVQQKATQMFHERWTKFKLQGQDRRQSSGSGDSGLSGNTVSELSAGDAIASKPGTPPMAAPSYMLSQELGGKDIPSFDRLSLNSDGTVPSATTSHSTITEVPTNRRRSTRAPFMRAHTIAVNPVTQSIDMPDCMSPTDVHMASPSPMTSLNLSPGKGSQAQRRPLAANIFAAANTASSAQIAGDPSRRWIPTNASDNSEIDLAAAFDYDDEGSATEPDDPAMLSPSRRQPRRKTLTKCATTNLLISNHGAANGLPSAAAATAAATAPSNAFRKPRPSLAREQTAPANTKRLTSAPSLFPPSQQPPSHAAAPSSRPASTVPVVASSPTRRTASTVPANITTSPTRRARTTVLAADTTSPVRKIPGGNGAAFRSKKLAANGGALPSSHNISSSNNISTTSDDTCSFSSTAGNPSTSTGATDTTSTTLKAALRNQAHAIHGRTLVELAQARAGGRDAFKSPVKSRSAPVWDPETDDMPSPFLVRGRGAVAAQRGAVWR